MSDEEKTGLGQFHAFLQRRSNKTNVALQEAQKLVNLYRVLNEFGPNFVDQYNSMLLNSSDEVQMALKGLVAGEEVRQYLDYIKEKVEKPESSNGKLAGSMQPTGYLPSPEDEVVANVGTGSDGAFISRPEWQEFLQKQEEQWKTLVTELKEEQQRTLTQLADQLSVVQKAKPVAQSISQADSYSEIIEETPKREGQ